jgi:hypothetical protein
MINKTSGILLLCITGVIYVNQTKAINKVQDDTMFKVSSSGGLAVTPSSTSSAKDFDFLLDSWTVVNRKLKARSNNNKEWESFNSNSETQAILRGIGNVEKYTATINGYPFEGSAIRLFNPKTRLWSIYWADSNHGVFDLPMVGSFYNNVGNFYSKDIFNGKPVITRFKWDATNPVQPLWSQATSADNGKTWEWNWYMHFTKATHGTGQNLNKDQQIKVIELRNYLLKPDKRDLFIDYFEEHFTRSQNILGGYTLGQFRIKDEDDHFFWIRGFHDMPSRKKFLNDFYYGSVWQQHRNVANGMLANNDNVCLLRPLNIDKGTIDSVSGFNSNWFGKHKGVTVVTFYTANQKRDKLIDFFKTQYVSLLNTTGITDISFWISEPLPNDFLQLPVFQDKNLLVSIAFYKDEPEYQTKAKQLAARITEDQKNAMLDLVTLQHSLILHPTKKSFIAQSQ